VPRGRNRVRRARDFERATDAAARSWFCHTFNFLFEMKPPATASDHASFPRRTRCWGAPAQRQIFNYESPSVKALSTQMPSAEGRRPNTIPAKLFQFFQCLFLKRRGLG
jgi:hypothetical protein